MPLLTPSSSYPRTLLYLPLPSLVTTITQQHQDFIRYASFLTSDSLTIYINAPDGSHYAHAPAAVWDELLLLLGTLYVVATGAAFENDQPLLNIEVLVDGMCGYDILAEAEGVYDTVLTLKDDEPALKSRLPPAFAIQTFDTEAPELPAPPFPKPLDETPIYHNVAVGGTFDHLHSGHKILLTMSAFLPTAGGRLTCGVTTDAMLREKQFRDEVETIEARIRSVRKFLDRIRRGIHYEVVEIADAFGPTITDPDFQALVVSKETEKGGVLVNTTRQERNFLPLDLKVIDVISQSSSRLQGESDIKTLKISSTWIREYLTKHRNPTPHGK